MSRFGRRLEVDRLRSEVPLTPFFFDLLYLDGKSLLDLTQEQRHEFLRRSLPSQLLIQRRVTGNRRKLRPSSIAHWRRATKG